MMRHFETVCLELKEIYERTLQDVNREHYNAELWRYNGHLRTERGSHRRVRFTYDLCRLAHFDPEGKVILDAGCGFGAIAIIFHLMGAREVHGVDIYEPRLTTFQQMIEDFQLHGVYARYASVENVPYPDQFFDMVLSNEAISHYSDVEGFLQEAARVLKPGGLLIIADGNNGANQSIRKHTLQLWERFENGPPGEIDGHRVTKPYVQMRAEIIRAAVPQLEEPVVEHLARATSGMTRDEILQALQTYCQTGQMPRMYYQQGTCPRNPETGAVAERLFHPRELATLVERFGFQARYYAYFGGADGNPIVRMVNVAGMMVSPWSIRWARAFRIVAHKR